MNFTYLAVQTHLTPSYRLFSILDATPIYRIGAPPRVAVKAATVNGRSVAPPFPCVLSGYDWRGCANGKGNRSSPLYAICLNWIHEIQFVDFDSKLFYGRHCQIEPDGEHPTSRERFILPIKPIRSREFNPFHRKHHKASNASSERRWKYDRTRQLPVGVLGVSLHLLVRFCFSYPKNRNDWIRTNDTCALQDVRPLHHACGRVSS